MSILEAAAPIQSMWLGEGDEVEVYRLSMLSRQRKDLLTFPCLCSTFSQKEKQSCHVVLLSVSRFT